MINPDRRSRQDIVLEHIITAYIELGAPVGSVVLRERANLQYSPATIRNVMAELEGLGFIVQPHTSAGRVPTDLGYRYYLDKIMQPQAITKDEKDIICSACDSNIDELETLLEKLSRLLSEISNEASMVLLPKIKKNMSKEIKLVSFGWHYLFRQPEFKDVSRSGRLLRVFEEKEELLDFVEENIEGNEVKVFIGAENKCSQMQDCSVAISGYGPDDDTIGAIGVIGPTRMPYSHVVPALDFIARQIDRALEDEGIER